MTKFRVMILGIGVGISLFHAAATAQSGPIEAKTEDGKLVVLSPDGTWKYKANEGKPNIFASDYAIVYFVRFKETFGMANRDRGVNLDDVEIFKMPQARFIGMKLKPGQYKLKMQQSKSQLHILAEAGKTYYIRISETTSGMGNDQSITELAEKEGIFQISLVKPLEDSKLKAPKDLFIVEKPSTNTK